MKDEDTLGLALKQYDCLLEFISYKDRDIITRNAYEKSEYACRRLQIIPAGVTEIYLSIWTDEVKNCWNALRVKNGEFNRFWTYGSGKGSDGKNLKPIKRSQECLEKEVEIEFELLYSDRVKSGLIR